MRYRKAKHKQGEQKSPGPERAEAILEKSFARLKRAEPDDATPLNIVRSRLEAQLADQAKKEHGIMASMKNGLRSWPRLSIGVSAAVCALILTALIPVSCDRTTGYTVDVVNDAGPAAKTAAGGAQLEFVMESDGGDVPAGPTAEQLTEALAAIGITGAEVSVNVDGTTRTVHISGLETQEEAREAAAAVEQLMGGSSEICPVVEHISSSLLGQIHDEIFRITVSDDGRTDDEIADEIRARLEAAGMEDLQVQYRSLDDGRRMIFLGMGDSCEVDGNMQVTEDVLEWIVQDSSAEGGVGKIMLETEGGSPEEIETRIREQLREQGLDTGDVEIRRITTEITLDEE